VDLRLDVDERLRHLNAPAGDIDAIPPKAEELAEAEPSEAGEERPRRSDLCRDPVAHRHITPKVGPPPRINWSQPVRGHSIVFAGVG